MPINPLQLPPIISTPKLDWSRLDQIGDAVVAAQRRQAISEAQVAATDPATGGLDQNKFGAELTQRGLIEEARPMMQLAQQQAQLRLSERQAGESERHNRATEGVQTQTLNKPTVVPWGGGLFNPATQQMVREPGGSETGLLDEPTLKAMTNQYIAGDTSVLTNLGRGGQGAANVVALRKKIAEINSGRGEIGAEQAGRNAEFFGTKAGQRTLGNRAANIEMAATEFKQVVPVVMEASKAVERTRFTDLNRILMAAEERTGDPNVVRFGSGLNTLITLYARAISPTGVPTVNDKEHAREVLQKAWSQDQFDAAVGMMMQEINAALASPEKVRDDMRRRFLGGQPGQLAAPNPAPANPASPAAIPAPPPGFQFTTGKGSAQTPAAPQLPKITNRDQANTAIGAAREAVKSGRWTTEQANDALRKIGAPPLAGP